MTKARTKIEAPQKTSSWEDDPPLQGSIEINTDVEFLEPFCSIHPDQFIYSGSSCLSCDTKNEERMRSFLADAGKYTIPCEVLDHVHECACWAGHECNVDTCEVSKKAHKPQYDVDGNDIGPNPMLVVAAAARNGVERSLCERVDRLEEANAALRTIIAKLVLRLPESDREALGCTEALPRA